MKILDFTAAWCGPCKQQKKELDKFRAKHPEIEVEIIDLTEDDDGSRPHRIANHYEINAIPTILVVTKTFGGKKLAEDSMCSCAEIESMWAEAQKARIERLNRISEGYVAKPRKTRAASSKKK